MNAYLINLVNYDNTSKTIVVLGNRSEAEALVKILECKCQKAVGMDYDEIMDFAKCNNLNFTKADVSDIAHYGLKFWKCHSNTI